MTYVGNGFASRLRSNPEQDFFSRVHYSPVFVGDSATFYMSGLSIADEMAFPIQGDTHGPYANPLLAPCYTGYGAVWREGDGSYEG